MREVIATGKTVEEATENGCAQLGLGRHEVSVEILEMPVKKLFKNSPAKVKVTADTTEQPAEAPAPVAAPAPEAAPPAPAQQLAKAAPAPATAQQTPAEAPKEAPEAAPVTQPKVLKAEPEESIDLAENPRAAAAVAYLASIFAAMGAADAQITALRQGDATLLRVEGEQVAQKIEIRGEVIQALSYLIDRAVNTGVDKKEDGYLRVRLDIAGYRSRREAELISLATRTGKEVARTGRSRTLAPMNPYERLIIHTAIGGIEGITSESIGADTERRVVVKSLAPNATDGGDWRGPRKGSGSGGGGRDRRDNRGGDRGKSRSGGGQRRQGGGGADRRPPSNTPQREYADKPREPGAAPIVPQPREAIKDGEDLPLYGKIDI
ncbi:Jag N-terminal domain-containing protein [Ruminococcaceae bacterium OttesenSCG-928-O06]|nr:Jag N-terminal domain-containing protein [Ruminococcaceae bacterium OttesenSCG-928-O06]